MDAFLCLMLIKSSKMHFSIDRILHKLQQNSEISSWKVFKQLLKCVAVGSYFELSYDASRKQRNTATQLAWLNGKCDQ